MMQDRVEDDELLYRSIPAGYYRKQEDGTYHISSSAFSDRTFRISVDRAALCNSEPSYTQRSERDGVASLVTFRVRSKMLIRNDANGNPINEYSVMVSADPLPTNPAHAIIHTDPIEKAVFRKLSEWLSRIALWVILPIDS